MRNRYLFLVFFVSLFIPIKRELYVPSMVNRKNQNDYEKLMDSYRDLTDAEYMTLNHNGPYKKSYDLDTSKRNSGRSLNNAKRYR